MVRNHHPYPPTGEILSLPLDPEGKWPATVESRAGRGRCSFDSKRGSPASNTLAVKPGAMQPLTDAQCILEAGVVSAGTALTHGSDRRGRGSHAGIADKVSKASVSYPTVWRRGYRARCAISRRLSWRWRRRRVSRPRSSTCVLRSTCLVSSAGPDGAFKPCTGRSRRCAD